MIHKKNRKLTIQQDTDPTNKMGVNSDGVEG
jgi:hypothetical protein